MSAQPAEAQEHGATPFLDARPRADASVFYFKQPVPIPSYLLALAVGQLESRELGPISRVSHGMCLHVLACAAVHLSQHLPASCMLDMEHYLGTNEKNDFHTK